MVATSDMVMILLTNTLGQSILIETLKSAFFFITCSNNVPKHFRDRPLFEESKACYFFIQGTGFDELISSYYLDYDPDSIRDGFNYYVRHQA